MTDNTHTHTPGPWKIALYYIDLTGDGVSSAEHALRAAIEKAREGQSS